MGGSQKRGAGKIFNKSAGGMMGKRSDMGNFLVSKAPPMLAAMGEEDIVLIDSTDGRDFYPTPLSAVLPLIPHVEYGSYDEPCAGDGALIEHLNAHGLHCLGKSDIEPKRSDIKRFDVFKIKSLRARCFITNPPWNRKILHPLIIHLSDIAPTWLLFDADWIHTIQSAPFMDRLRKVVSVGRVKWIPDSKMTGKDNCAWHLFDKPSDEPTIFFGRVAK